MKEQNQLRVRLTLPDDIHGMLWPLAPVIRSKMVSQILVGSMDHIDLLKLQDSSEQLRRAGVLLNQALRAYHMDGDQKLDMDKVEACCDIIWRLQSTRYP